MAIHVIEINEALYHILIIINLRNLGVLELSWVKRIIQVLRILEEIPFEFEDGFVERNGGRATDLLVEHVLPIGMVEYEISLLIGNLKHTDLRHRV